MVKIGNDWDGLLAGEFEKPYYLELRAFLKKEYGSRVVYPSMHDIFNALKYTAYGDVNAVILGQDPYHGPGQAHGLCFSVQRGLPPPPSLQNIFRELRDELGIRPPGHGCLTGWARQGVLLLNTALTVRAGEANSHRGRGWETFTDRVVSLLAQREEPMAFLLWGANARAKAPLLAGSRHLVLAAAHPSPLSASSGFFGCGHFAKTNAFLAQYGRHIDWAIEP
ncbi:MAG: uracil-DNA glycosylase [Clostridiales Family XIII bacterium]|jgi:uracil-DNA glycosylase|nr:uracil-DNA glycosylase [Clostridiales Family XIII bacterium]